MKKLQFSTSINAPASRVWEVLWNDNNYRQWTSVFSEGSHAVSDWKEGSPVHFLSNDGRGMYSVIDQCRENSLMAFRHLGMIKDGIEQPLDDESRKWTGSMEIYKLTETEGTTNLTVEVDVVEEYQDYFLEKFPKALEQVQNLCLDS